MNPIEKSVKAMMARALQKGGGATVERTAKATFTRDALALGAAAKTLKVAPTSAVPRPKTMTGKQVIKLLQEHGFTLDRVKGSHHIMVRGGTTLPVPVHGNDTLGKGLLAAIFKQAGL